MRPRVGHAWRSVGGGGVGVGGLRGAKCVLVAQWLRYCMRLLGLGSPQAHPRCFGIFPRGVGVCWLFPSRRGVLRTRKFLLF